MQDFYNMPPIIRDFLSHKFTIEGKSELTVKEYSYDLQTFFRYMLAKNEGITDIYDIKKIDIKKVDIEFIKKISLSDIYDYLLFLSRDMNNSVKSRARKLSAVKSFFKYISSDTHILPNNITKDLQLPKIPKKLPVYLELSEAKQLLSAPSGKQKQRDYFILTILLNCGLRVSELKNLSVNDIKGDTIKIHGKGNKERLLFLNDATREALFDYLKVRKPKNPNETQVLLSNSNDKLSINGIQYIVKNLIRKAGLDATVLSVHKLRHTAATLMYKYGGVDVRALQEVLGHEQLNTTQIYTHTDKDTVKNALNNNPLSSFKK